ncbi:MAG: hypothetical protein K6E79_06945 [Pseudobutyrivibrio sp.]|nr:hypothetical protein [Pseudobutyrivibrio sp.]
MSHLSKRNKICYVLGILALVFVASLPAFRSGIYQGHDLSFHLGRIQAIAEELRTGHFPVRYESSAWYGHGYVSTTFYGNIFLYIPALLYMAGLPVWRAYNIYLILVNLFTVLVGFYSFKGIFNSHKWGFLATGIYTLAGYRLSNLYVRTALGEYTAMIFVPLVIYGVYRIYVSKGKYSTIRLIMPLIIGTTGLIQSHILTTELIAAFVFIFAVINFKTTIACIKELLLALVAILGVNAFFLIPFIDAYTSMDLYINTHLSQTSIRADGLYMCQLFGTLTMGRGSSYPWTAEGEGYLNIGILTIICFAAIVLQLILAFAKKNWRQIVKKSASFKMIVTLFCFGLLAAWMSTVYFPWDAFAGNSAVDQLMSSVQYPWRYVMIVTVCFTICGVYAIRFFCSRLVEKSAEKVVAINRIDKHFVAVLALVGAIAVVATAYFDYTLSWGNVTVANQDADINWADKLYLIDGTDRDLLDNTDIEVDGNKVTLPVFAYENMHVFDAEGNELAYTVGQNNCIQVTYDGDYTQLTVKFIEPLSWRVSEVVSLICVIGLVVVYNKKNKR